MSEYLRMKDIIPVCTNNEAREYFRSCGLSYDDVTEGDILTLVMLLNREIKKSNKSGETSMGTLTLSKKIEFVNSSKRTMKRCFLYVNSHYLPRGSVSALMKMVLLVFVVGQIKVTPILF